MTFSRALRCVVCCAMVVAGFHVLAAQQAPVLWGGLKPGPYAVGYRVVYAFDQSRTWHVSRTYTSPRFSPDMAGRPLRISVWYPATAAKERMRVGEYLRNRAPEAFRAAEEALEKRDGRVIAEWVPAGELENLMQSSTAAYRDARPVAGAFPLVLYAAGVNGYTESNLVMAEFLASHGFVVATVPSLGESDAQTEQAYSKQSLEASVRDMEFAWSVLRKEATASKQGFGMVGHSLGGIVSLMLAMRNSDVLAVAGLDGSYGFAELQGLLTDSYRYDPAHMQAALLDIRRADAQIDMKIAESLRHSARWFATVRGMSHGDFTSFALGAYAFHQAAPTHPPAGWTRESSFSGHQLVCGAVLQFLNAQLRHDDSALQGLDKDMASSAIASYSREPAAPLVPSTQEFVAMVRSQGVDGAVQTARKIQAGSPGETVVDEAALNQAGYGLMGEKKFGDAVRVLEFAAGVYPQSANAADSLGDAYIAAEQKEKAVAAFRRALELVATDPTLQQEMKKTIESDAKAKIQTLTQ
jgi:dienelactone hydrolase